MKTKREHEQMKWMFEWKKLVLDANKIQLFLITNILRFLKWILNINHCRLSVAKLIITITHGGSNQFFVHLIHLLSASRRSCSFLAHTSDINDLLEGLDGVLEDWLNRLHDTESSLHIVDLWHLKWSSNIPIRKNLINFSIFLYFKICSMVRL